MSWLSVPAGLILAAAVIPPLILLYFLKLRRRTQPIACTLLWKRAIEDLRANAPFQRLRKSLLLLLQLLALILLVLAIMQPQIQAAGRKGGRTIMLIDTSASMTATDVDEGMTRLDEAKRRAKERVETIYGRGLFTSSAGETMVIAFSDRAEVASRFTDSKPQLLAAIDAIRPTHGNSRIGEALILARAYTTDVNPDAPDRPVDEPGTLELFSDGRISDLQEQVLRGETLLYHPIGSERPDNVAITGISIERPYDRPTAVEVFASMANFNEEPVTVDVQLSVNGTARAIEEIEIGAATHNPATGLLVPERSNVIFTPFEQPRGAVIEVAIIRPDDLRADDAARLVVPPPKLLRVALVAPKSFLLRTVLEGISSIERLDVYPNERRFETMAADENLEQYDVIVLDDYAPPADLMQPVRYLTFGAIPNVEGLNEYGQGKDQLILDSRADHPIFKFVNLDKLYISKYRALQPADDVVVLAEGSRSPLFLEVTRGSMRLLVLPFDPLDSNWPFQRSFVTFMVNAVEYLGMAGEAISESSYLPGTAITTRLPATASDIVMNLPDGGLERFQPLDPTQLSWGPVRLSGVHLLRWNTSSGGEQDSRAFAVNLLSEAEGDLRPAETVLARERDVKVAGRGGSAWTALWPWAIGMCLLVMMLEWWVYHRKAYI